METARNHYVTALRKLLHQGQWLKVGWVLSLLVVLSLLFVPVDTFNPAHARADEPGEVLVIRLKPLLGAKGLKGPAHTAALKAGSKVAQEKLISEVKEGGGTVIKTLWLANAVLAKVTPSAKAKLASLPGVDRIHPNYVFSIPEPTIELKTADVAPSGHFIGDKTWGLDFLDIDGLWSDGYIGTGIKVAVLDTGVDITHPIVAGRMCGRAPYYRGCWAEFDSGGGLVPGSVPHDSSYHGTHVSATAVGGFESDFGAYIGVARGASLMHGLVLPGGSGTFTQVVAGMEWAGDNGADVVSISLGADGFYEVFIEPVQNLLDDGIIPVMAIGNSGAGATGSPGNVYDAWATGAVDEYHSIAYFSGGDTISTPGDWGSPSGTAGWPDTYIKPDFSAPGVSVLSAIPMVYAGYYGDPPYYYLDGTSMATPHLAGAVALLLNFYNSLPISRLSASGDANATMDLIYDCLRSTAMDHGAPGMDPRFGHGMVLADGAAACMREVGGHDLAVTSIEVAPAPKKSMASTIKVTVKNEGTVNETFNVETYAGATLLSTTNVANLAANATKVIATTWTPGATGSVTLIGKIKSGDVPADIDTGDREKTLNVTVTLGLKLSASSKLTSPKEASVTVQLRTPDGKADLAEGGIEVTLSASGGTLSASSVVTNSSGKAVVKVTPKGKSASFTVKAKALTASASAKGTFPTPIVSVKVVEVKSSSAEIEVSVSYKGFSPEGTVVSLTSTKGAALSFTKVTLGKAGKAKVLLVPDKPGVKSTVTARVDAVSSKVVVKFPK